MTSLIFLVVLKVLGLYCIPTKFHCSQRPNGRVNLGGAFLPPPSKIGCARTPSKIGLKICVNIPAKMDLTSKTSPFKKDFLLPENCSKPTLSNKFPF